MCSPCPRNTYSDDLAGSAQCTVCTPFGFSSPVGSTDCSIDASYWPYPATFPAYSAINGYTVYETIGVCGGYTLYFSSCGKDGGSNTGSDSNNGVYSNLWLYDVNAAGTQQLAAGGDGLSNNGNDNICDNAGYGGGAYFTYAFTGPCKTYVIAQGCAFGDSCGGTVAIHVKGAAE